MKTTNCRTRGLALLLGGGLGLALLLPGAAGADDIKKLVGPDECGECHKKEVTAWRQTRHYKTFNELSRTKEAREIGKKMGLRRLKQESACLDCHFTAMEVGGKEKTVAGITCESCHGAARDWIKIHSDYGGKGVTKEQETAAHKKKRLAGSVAGGMLSPDDLYAVANNCYQCHLVPNEELVNKGGHKAGSAFELVAWSQGEVRHNYFSSKTGEENLEADTNRRRMMFVLGIALELEHTLRAVGEATVKADYAVKMAKRVKTAVAKLKQVATLIEAPEVSKMARIGGSAKLSLNNKAALTKDADQVGKLAKAFADKYDGKTFSALDKYLPTRYKGKVHG
jgi:hypothetical protein